MTELLYQTDSYLREFDATITASFPDERAVALDRTAFYPGGGGQPNDVGTLAALNVVKVTSDVKSNSETESLNIHIEVNPQQVPQEMAGHFGNHPRT